MKIHEESPESGPVKKGQPIQPISDEGVSTTQLSHASRKVPLLEGSYLVGLQSHHGVRLGVDEEGEAVVAHLCADREVEGDGAGEGGGGMRRSEYAEIE